jgi:tetratricopeptide (TPR) repeat protein
MSDDRREAVRTAEKLVARGKLEAAILEYRKVLRDTPEDTGTLNRVGDLFVRLGRLDEAVETFDRAAEHFVQEGFFVKAIAIYKKIIRLDPTRIGAYQTLADLYHRQGLQNEARSQYQVVADYYSQAGEAEKVREIYEKIVDLEADNPTHRVKLAEFYCAAGMLNKAVEQYQTIAGFMLEHGKVEEALKVYLGALELNPTDLGFVTDVVLHLKDVGQEVAADRLLEAAINRNPEAVRVREIARMASSPQPSSQAAVDETGSAVIESEIIEEEAATPAAGREMVEEELVEAQLEPRGDEASPVEVTTIPPEATEDDEEVVVLDLEEEEELPFAVEVEGEIDLALDDLEEGAPADGPTAEVAATGEPGELEVAEVAGVTEAPAEEPPLPPATEGPAVVEVIGQVEAEEVTPETEEVERLLTEARVLATYGLEEKAADLCEEVIKLDPANLEAFGMLVDLHHASDRPDLVVEFASQARDALGDREDAWDELAGRLQEKGYEIRGVEILPPAGQVVEEIVEEVGDLAEEESMLVEPQPEAEEPGPQWLEREPVADVDFTDADALFGAEDEFFDLAAELEEELREEEERLGAELVPKIQEQSLEEIVEGFKKGVAETLSEEDYETHYNLGIAYREMGLLDEAIGEFQLAAKATKYLVDCCSLLGSCFLEKGFPDLAIKWYERGLEAPQATENESLGLLYELGNLYVTTGDRETARKTFAEVYGINSNYRDVVAKLAELNKD